MLKAYFKNWFGENIYEEVEKRKPQGEGPIEVWWQCFRFGLIRACAREVLVGIEGENQMYKV